MKNELGKKGEELAVHHLRERGFRILERNYRCPQGEIDIIAREKKVVCFIEVKARRSILFGKPCEFVDQQKQRKILKTAQRYLVQKKILDKEIRFDVVSIHIPGGDAIPQIELIRDAFPADGDLGTGY